MKWLKIKYSRIVALLLTFVMIFTMVPTTAFAADRDTSKNQVRVIVENTKYSVDEGAAWDGTLIDTWVDLKEESNMMTCFVEAIEEAGYTQSGAEADYISMINDLYAGAPDYMSGWMCMLNDWMINEGLGQFTVANGKLEAGDEIKIAFSLDGGPDLGGTWGNNDKSLSALLFDAGELTPVFDSSIKDYTLTLPEGTKTITVTPTAVNKNFQVRTSVGDTEYKRNDKIPVENGTVLTVACGNPEWPSMNNGELGSGAEAVPAEVYTVTVVQESTNTAPSLTGDATGTAAITTEEKYALDLTKVFTDADKDELAYTVSVNGADAIEATAAFSYAPATAGTYTLVFTANDGKANSDTYTVTLTVEEAVKGTPVEVDNNVIDIADKTIKSFSKYSSVVKELKIDGATVVSATEDGTTIYVVLDYATSPSAEISVDFITSHNYVRDVVITESNTQVALKEGKGQLATVITSATSPLKGTVTYNIVFSLEKPPTEVPERLVEGNTMEVYAGISENLKLSEYFKNAKEYYLVENGEFVKLESSDYTFLQTTGGEYKLTFAASNNIGMCPEYVEITVNVKALESGIWLNHATSNGSLDYVLFSDADGNPIEGLKSTFQDTTIRVTIPKTYDLAGKVTATFKRTANDSGFPFLSSSNAFNQGTGSKKDVYTTTLSNGSGTATMYLYNSTPKATSNVYTTFYIKYAVENALPVLAQSQSEISAEIEAGQNYTLNLSELFTDADGDALSYKVSINGADAVDADAKYAYTTDIAGEYTLVFTANDGKDDSTETYTVNLTVKNVSATYAMTVNVPEEITPTFYVTNGFGDDGADVLGDELTAVKGDTSDGMTAYTVNYPTNAQNISVRSDGVGIAIPVSEGGSLNLQLVQISPVNFAKESVAGNSEVTYVHGEKTVKAVGNDGKYLLQAGQEYTCTAVPGDTGTYANGTKTETLEEGVSAIEVEVPYKNPKTITVTTGATAQMFSYNKYYDMTEHKAKAVIDNQDGTTTYYFTPDKGFLSYRVSMDGKVTKAGYLDINVTQKWNLTVDYTKEERTPDTRVDYAGASAANASVGDDSVLVNVNGQNHLQMSAGGTYKLKGYRAWEIIKYSYQNEIITPDFHFEILSGEDVISLTPADSNSHSGSGDKSDWVNVNALKEGTAIIEVSYDAIDVAGGSWPGLYGASDPARTGLVVVTVGGADKSVDFGIEGHASQGSLTFSETNKKDWDAEFDTIYFTGDHGELNFSPTAGSAISEVAVSNDKGNSWTVLNAEEDIYTANLISGNNILRVTTENGVAYQVVRGKQINVSVKEVMEASDGDGLLEAGEKIRVSLNGLHTPIPKMAGNYNPGFKGNYDGDSSVHMVYTFNDKEICGPGAQYTFAMDANYLELTIPEDTTVDKYVLDKGYISLGIIGLKTFADGGDSHRNIPDGGCTTRGSETTFHTRSILPEIEIKLGEAAAENQAPDVNGNALTENTIELGQKFVINPETLFTDPDGDALTFKASVDGGDFENITTAYQFVPETAGTFVITFIASDGKAEASHSITLTVKEAQIPEDTELEFDISGDQIKGYVTVSFEDKGVRVEGEKGLKYPVPLGTIIEETKVPYTTGDNVAAVTLRLLDAMNIGYTYSGTVESGFYLSSIKNFVVDNTPYDEMGEFMAGQGSGWMITLNDVFINRGSSDFEVKDGDVLIWKYTCQLGADIGDVYNPDEGGDNPGGNNPGGDDTEKVSVEEIYKTTGDYMASLGVPTVNSVGGDWMALGLARSGRTVSDKYYENAADYVEENMNEYGQLHFYKSTDNSRVILGLTATGHDPSNVGGYNLLQGLSDMEYVGKQGVNGYFWALISLDSHDYEVPKALNGQEQVTREKLIQAILDAQLSDHGWALAGDKADVDMTAMAIQALAPYYESNDDVKHAVDKALSMLSSKQREDGRFGGSEGITAESCAQVVVALTALGINPDTDARFIKNETSVLDALCSFYVEGGGFRHIDNGKLDGMATEQGYYALTAYMRLLEGKTSLYDMSDVTLSKDDTPAFDNEELKNQVAANEVKSLIEAIGKVTIYSENRIKEAREAYDSLTDAQKKLVDNYAVLLKAEEDFKVLDALGSKTNTKGLGKVDETDGPKVTKTAKETKALMEDINANSLEGEILDAILAYENLTKEEKEAIDCGDLYVALKAQLRSMIQMDKKTGIVLDGCDWNIRLVVKEIEDMSGLEDFEKKIGDYTVIGIWDIYLENVKTGEKYQPEEAIRIKIPTELLEEMHVFDGIAIAHYTEDGKVEYFKCDVEDGYVVFHALEFSYYAVIGYNGEGPAVLDAAAAGASPVLGISLACGALLLVGIVVLAIMRKKLYK